MFRDNFSNSYEKTASFTIVEIWNSNRSANFVLDIVRIVGYHEISLGLIIPSLVIMLSRWRCHDWSWNTYARIDKLRTAWKFVRLSNDLLDQSSTTSGRKTDCFMKFTEEIVFKCNINSFTVNWYTSDALWYIFAGFTISCVFLCAILRNYKTV